MVSKVNEKRLREAAKELFNLLKPENSPVPDDLDELELWVARASRIKNEEGEWDITTAEIKSLSFHTQEIVKSMRTSLGKDIISNAKKEKDMSKKETKAEKPATKVEKEVKETKKPTKKAEKKVEKKPAKETRKVEKKPAAKAEKKADKPKAVKKEKCVIEKTKHGHKVTTAMGIIDNLMLNGGTNKEAVHKALTKSFPEKKYTPEQTHHYLRTFCANLAKRDLSYSCKAGVYSFRK